MDPSSWDGACQVLSLFRTEEILSKDVENINVSLTRIINHIKNYPVNCKALSGEYTVVIKSLWDLINVINVLKWDFLIFDKENKLTINKCIMYHFALVSKGNTKEKSSTSTIKKPIENTTPLASMSTLTSVVIPLTTSTSVVPPSTKNIVRRI